MDVPAGERLTLVRTNPMPPAIGQGALVRFDGDALVIRLDVGSPALAPDDTVVVDFVRTEHPLVRGQVDRIGEVQVWVHVDRLQARDQREFPRVEQSLDVRYRVVPDEVLESVLERWVRSGAALPAGQPWRQPEPLMDLSASGLGFDDEVAPTADDRLMVEFRRPDQRTPHRATARVVRVRPTAEGRHRIAIEFVRISEEASHALMEWTIESLRLPGETDET